MVVGREGGGGREEDGEVGRGERKERGEGEGRGAMGACGRVGRVEVGDPQSGEAAWRIGVLDRVLHVIISSATQAARLAPHDTSSENNFDSCAGAHNELHLRRGYYLKMRKYWETSVRP